MLPQRREIASVVVCEDDAVTLELLCDHLAADRFGVLPAPSASDALRLCRYNQPDLLLLDLSLPDASGLDVLREIREADGVDSRFDPQPAGDRPDRPRRPGRSRARARVRRRRLSGQAVPLSGAAGPDRRRAAAAAEPPRGADPGRRAGRRPARGAGSGSGSARCRCPRRSSRCCASSPATRPGSSPRRELLDEVWGYRTPGARRAPSTRTRAGCRRKLDPEHSRYVVNCWGVGYRLLDG